MEQERRILAHRVVFTLWPDMPPYRREHVTPEVATYLFVLFERVHMANQLIQGLEGLLIMGPITAWSDIPEILINAVRKGLNAGFATRGLAIRGILEYHRHLVQSALQQGPDFPLALIDALGETRSAAGRR
jgi:hypothetical protein